MSLFGKNELQNIGINATYIPHGVNTDNYKPVEDNSEQKKWLWETAGTPLNPNKSLSWDVEDLFIIGKNAANKDTKRKGYDKEMRAIRIFLDENPDAAKNTRIYWHTDPRFPGGFPLDHYAKIQGISEFVRFTKQFYQYCNFSEENMAKMYQGFDLLLNASRGEGFGIPIIEAQACGVPVIGTKWTSMTELIKGHGWLVNPVTTTPTQLLSNMGIPNEWEIAEYIEDAYNNPDKRRKYGEDACKFTRDHYDWNNVIDHLWIDLIEKIRDELGEKTLQERRIA
jgi:glycosyltransferase involved in cell wall biosynthesis